MHYRLLRLLALVFVALVLLQAFMGGILFYKTIGFGADQIFTYYHDKSFHGLLEVILPHTLFIGIALMSTLHFLAFIETLTDKMKKTATHLLFTLFILDQASPILILLGMHLFAYVKMVAFIGFELGLGWVWALIFKQTLKELK